MQAVADALDRLQNEDAAASASASPETAKEVKRLRRTVTSFGAIAILLAAVGAFYYFYMRPVPTDIDSTLEEHAERYAGSIAFVVVQYQIRVEDSILYSRVSEGTAFLADTEGYLLTNRHVACPWLEDDKLLTMVRQVRQIGKQPVFEYRMYLWFEGDSAFNRLVGIGAGGELDDVYDLDSAYSRGGDNQIGIAGVARSTSRTGSRIRTPLKDDFAVLRVNRVPAGIVPLPLDRDFRVDKADRLAPVIALGFPLGNRTQADVINVSVTKGHIRRTFKDFFQVDTSIYKGNSGGPIIDEAGNVIGIASAVATDVAVAPMPVITQLSDIGLVLPVGEAAKFLDELKSGQVKWNGTLDLSADSKIREIMGLAREGSWLEAQQKAEQGLEDSDAPSLVMTAAIMKYCNDDLEGARVHLDRLLSIDPDNHEARLMRALSEKPNFRRWKNKHVKQLMGLDWHSSGEFYGHLATMLNAGKVDDHLLGGWNTASEKSWLYFIAGLIVQDKDDDERSRELFKEAARSASEDEWPLYLALAALDFAPPREQTAADDRSEFDRELQRLADERIIRSNLLRPLAAKFDAAAGDLEARREIIMQIQGLQPDNRKLLAYGVYYHVMTEDWEQSLQLADRYLALPGREEPLRLGTGLLPAALLAYQGRDDEAAASLERYCDATDTAWYRQICETLKGERSVDDLLEKGGNFPEKVLTASTYLGFASEAAGNNDRAIKYYREALGSYVDTWIEFELARHRYMQLRQTEK